MSIRLEARLGPVVDGLVDHVAGEQLLALGPRVSWPIGQGPWRSVGSAVAARSSVPVVVVPQRWEQSLHRCGPIMIGLRPHQPDRDVLEFAFGEAERHGTELVIVEVPEQGRARSDESEQCADRWDLLALFHRRFAATPLRLVSVAGPVSEVLVEHSREAQLLVLGRRNRAARLGSVGRDVLRHGSTPVAIVPRRATPT